mgnify:FL=1
MSEKKVTKSDLSKVKYGELLAKFTELGVPEVWIPGSKKMTMIEKAIAAVQLKASLESQGLDKKEIEDKVIEIEEAKVVAKQKEEIAIVEQKEAEQKIAKEKIIKSDLTLEEINYNIKNLESLIKFGIQNQRVGLQLKLEWLLELKKSL